MFRRIFKKKRKPKYRVSTRETREEQIRKKEMTKEQKFYWARAITGGVSALLGVLVFRLKGWWLLLFLVLFWAGWPFIQSFLIFRLPYKKGKWDWKKILKTGFGAFFFIFMFVGTICFSLITLPEYQTKVNNPADTNEIVFYDNDTALIADGTNGFLVLDIDSPSHRELVGKLEIKGENITHVYLDGNLVYITTENGDILELSIEDLENPLLLSTYALNASITGLIKLDRILFISTADNGLFSLDMDNDFQILDHIPSLNYSHMEIHGNLAYLLNTHNQLDVYNITNAENLNYILSLDLIDSEKDFHINENNLYLISNEGNFTIYNISNINNPNLIGSLFLNKSVNKIYRFQQEIFISGSLNGIVFIDISDLTNPVNTTNGFYNTLGPVKDMIISGDYLYLAEGMKAIDYIYLPEPGPEPEEDSTQPRKTISSGWTWLPLSLSLFSFILFYERKKNNKNNG